MTTKVPAIHFDTAMLPPGEGFAHWRVAVADYDVAPPEGSDPAAFYARVNAWMLGDFVVSAGELSAMGFARSQEKAAADGFDQLVFLLLKRGGWTGNVEGRPLTAGPGQVVAFDLTRAFAAAGIASDSISLRVARGPIAAAVPPGADLHGFVFRGVTGRVLADHLIMLTNQLPAMELSEAPAAAKATVGLIASCVAVSPDMREPAGPAAEVEIRHRVGRYIDQNLGARDLTPARICAALDLSRSVLYRAFAPLNGIASYIRTRRLEAVHVLLDDRRERRDISDISTDFGFVSAAHFSRVFRQRFGYSPRKARVRARNGFHQMSEALSNETGPAVFSEWMRQLG